LKEKLKSKDAWSTPEVRALIRKEFDVVYSNRQVSRILREFKMHHDWLVGKLSTHFV
jgi:transposase